MPWAIRALLTVLGRLMLSTIFLMSTLGNKIPHFNDVANLMEMVGIPAPQLMLVGAIVFLLVGSLSLIFGFKARFGAFLLLVFLVLATYYFHNFWAQPTPEQQQEQMIQFMKNLGLMGAMLFIIANGPGPASLDAMTARRRGRAPVVVTPGT
jgi:putative oxidoreductase